MILYGGMSFTQTRDRSDVESLWMCAALMQLTTSYLRHFKADTRCTPPLCDRQLASFVRQSNSALLCVERMGEEWRRIWYINKYILCLVMKMSSVLCCIIMYVSFVSVAYSAGLFFCCECLRGSRNGGETITWLLSHWFNWISNALLVA